MFLRAHVGPKKTNVRRTRPRSSSSGRNRTQRPPYPGEPWVFFQPSQGTSSRSHSHDSTGHRRYSPSGRHSPSGRQPSPGRHSPMHLAEQYQLPYPRSATGGIPAGSQYAVTPPVSGGFQVPPYQYPMPGQAPHNIQGQAVQPCQQGQQLYVTAQRPPVAVYSQSPSGQTFVHGQPVQTYPQAQAMYTYYRYPLQPYRPPSAQYPAHFQGMQHNILHAQGAPALPGQMQPSQHNLPQIQPYYGQTATAPPLSPQENPAASLSTPTNGKTIPSSTDSEFQGQSQQTVVPYQRSGTPSPTHVSLPPISQDENGPQQSNDHRNMLEQFLFPKCSSKSTTEILNEKQKYKSLDYRRQQKQQAQDIDPSASKVQTESGRSRSVERLPVRRSSTQRSAKSFSPMPKSPDEETSSIQEAQRELQQNQMDEQQNLQPDYTVQEKLKSPEKIMPNGQTQVSKEESHDITENARSVLHHMSSLSKGPSLKTKGHNPLYIGTLQTTKGPGNLNKGSALLQKGPSSLDKGPQLHNQGPSHQQKGPQSLNKGPAVECQGPTQQKGPTLISNGPTVLSKGPSNVSRGATPFSVRQSLAKGQTNQAKGPSHLERGPSERRNSRENLLSTKENKENSLPPSSTLLAKMNNNATEINENIIATPTITAL